MFNSTLVEGADMLEDELKDGFETLSAVLQGEDGFEVERALNALKSN
jgi:hypothetical protein